jgi:hypothetical protein
MSQRFFLGSPQIAELISGKNGLDALSEDDVVNLVRHLAASSIDGDLDLVTITGFDEYSNCWQGYVKTKQFTLIADEDEDLVKFELNDIEYDEQWSDVQLCLGKFYEFWPGMYAFFYTMKQLIEGQQLPFGQAWNEVIEIQELSDAIADWREKELYPRLGYEPDTDILDELLEETITSNDWSIGKKYHEYYKKHGMWPDNR